MRTLQLGLCLALCLATAFGFFQQKSGTQMRSLALGAKANANSEIIGNTKLSGALAEKMGISLTKANEALTFLIDTMKTEVQNGNKVRLHQFGTFSQVATAARNFRNPKTGGTISKPAGSKLSFKASSVAKAELAGKKPAKAKKAAPAKKSTTKKR